jgi:hypothetical protein
MDDSRLCRSGHSGRGGDEAGLRLGLILGLLNGSGGSNLLGGLSGRSLLRGRVLKGSNRGRLLNLGGLLLNLGRGRRLRLGLALEEVTDTGRETAANLDRLLLLSLGIVLDLILSLGSCLSGSGLRLRLLDGGRCELGLLHWLGDGGSSLLDGRSGLNRLGLGSGSSRGRFLSGSSGRSLVDDQ